jgi:hypothetical protein
MHVRSVITVLEVHAASIFRVKEGRVSVHIKLVPTGISALYEEN